MLLKRDTLVGIGDGSVTLAFRRWRRPTVKTGGTLLTAIGQLSIESVSRVELQAIPEAEAVAAGFSDLKSLRAQLMRRSDGEIYRIEFRLLGPDLRISLRDRIPDHGELADLHRQLERIDSRSRSGPWALRALALISSRPASPAAELAKDLGMEKAAFKAKVRRLKGLGLTESLEVGYRLSPRGKALLQRP